MDQDSTNVVDPSGSRPGNPKTAKKTKNKKPIPSREDEKRTFLGKIYSEMLYGDYSMKEIAEEQVRASARFDKWKPETVEEVSRPADEEAGPSEKPRPLENSRPSEVSRPSAPADLTAVAPLANLMEESNVAEVSTLEKPRPLESVVSATTEQTQLVVAAPEPADLTTVSSISSKPIEEASMVEASPSATPRPSEDSGQSRISEPADPTTVALQANPMKEPNLAEVLTSEKPRPSEDSRPSETPVLPQPTQPSPAPLKPTPKPAVAEVPPPANSRPLEEVRPATVARHRFSSTSSDDWEFDREGQESVANIAKISAAVKNNEYWDPSMGTSEVSRPPGGRQVKEVQGVGAQGSSTTVPETPLETLGNPRPPMEESRPPTTSTSGPSLRVPFQRSTGLATETPSAPTRTPTLFKEGLTMQEEILRLTKEEHKIYTDTLQKLSAVHNFSLSPTPDDPSHQNQFEVVQDYTAEQCLRFQAMSAVWTARGVPSVDESEACPFVTTVSGHYALYQVQENCCWKQWNAVAWYPTRVPEVRVAFETKIIGSQLPAIPTVIIGDVLIVKEMIGALVLKFQILKRSVRTEQAARLYNGLYVVKGYGRAVECEVAQKNFQYLKKARFYVPIRCSPATPETIKIGEFEEEEKRGSWTEQWREFHERNRKLSPEAIDYLTVLGSSLYTTFQYGKFDEQVYRTASFQHLPNGHIQFKVFLGVKTNKRWSPGVYVSIDGGRWILEVVQVLHSVDQRFHLVTAKLLRGQSSAVALCAPGVGGGTREVRQVGAHLDRPMLEAGFFEKLDKKSNGRRIISAIFGPREEWAEPDADLLEQLENLEPLNTPQREYLRRLLGHAPITFGKFSILSGKTSTIAWTALKLAQRDPKSMNLILTPDAKRADLMSARIRELSNPGRMSNAVSIMSFGAGGPDFDLEQFLVDVYAGRFTDSSSHLEKVEESLQDLKNAPLDYWLEVYLQLDPPQVLILDLKEFWRVCKLLQNVASIQFDDMQEIPQMELIHIASEFPDAVYGLMGDPDAGPLGSEVFYRAQNALVAGELLRRAEQYFPVVESKEVYNVAADVVNLLNRRFGKVNEVWIDLQAKRRLEDYAVQIWSAPNPESMMEIVRRLIQEAKVPPDDIGVVCMSWKQVEAVKSSNLLGNRTFLGHTEDFVGVQKKVVIVLSDPSCRSTPQDLTFLMTRGSERVHLVQLQNLLQAHKEWRAVLNAIREAQKNTVQQSIRNPPAMPANRPQ